MTDITPAPSQRRVLLAVSAAAVLAVLGHLAGGGTPTASCGVVLVALGATVVTTYGAAWVDRRARGPSSALAILALGQLLIEGALSAQAHHLPTALPSATVHGISVVAIGALLMGGARTFHPVATVVRRWLPASVRAETSPYSLRRDEIPREHQLPGDGRLAGSGPRVSRGPPLRHSCRYGLEPRPAAPSVQPFAPR